MQRNSIQEWKFVPTQFQSFILLHSFLLNIKKSKMDKAAQCLKITEKVAFNIASEASYVYVWVYKSSSKMPKMASFWKLSWKIQMWHFWCFSNQCAIFLNFFCNSSSRPFKYFCTEMIMMDWAWKSLKVDVKCSLLDLPGAMQALHPFTSQVEKFLCQIQ